MMLDREQRILFCLVSGYMSIPLLGQFYTAVMPRFVILAFYALGLLGVLAICGFVFLVSSCRWAFSRVGTVRKLGRRWAVFSFGMGVYSLFLLILAIIYAGTLPIGSYAKAFDQKRWKENQRNHSTMEMSDRQQMLGHVVDTLITGGNKQRIIQKLGTPQQGSYPNSICYNLGYTRLGMLDNEYLEIWFDDQGQVIKFDIYDR